MKKDNKKAIWIVLCLAAIVIISCLGMYADEKDRRAHYESLYYKKNDELQSVKDYNTSLEERISSLETRLNEARTDIEQKESELSDLKSSSDIPLQITRVEMGATDWAGEVEVDYGNTLYASQIKYVEPKIWYKCFHEGTYNLKLRYFKSDGTFMYSKEHSPEWFTMQGNYYISGVNRINGNNRELDGWGNKEKGVCWKSGEYRLEIWYMKTCLYVKYFTVY